MKKKKRVFIFAFVILNLILIPWIIIYNNYCFDSIIKTVRELVVFEFSAISLMIAVSLFDQFGLNKKLTEKRVELIIELLTELKKEEGFGSHYKIGGKTMSNPSFYFEKNMVEKYSNQDYIMDILDIPIVINSHDFEQGFKKVRAVANNPIMPKTIVEKIQFLGLSGGVGGGILNEYPKLIYIYITHEAKMQLVKKETEHWVFSSNNRCTLREFLQKFDDLFLACEDWTNKHSNMDEELNLKNF